MEKILWIVIRGLVYGLLKIFCHFKVYGKENVENLNGPIILIANHISHMDPPVLAVAWFRKSPIRFMTKKKYSFPPLGWFIKSLGSFFVDYDEPISAIRESLEILKKNGTLGIFPEGTRSKDGKLQKFQKGAKFLAKKSNAIVIPVVILGTYRPGRGFWSILKKIGIFLIFGYRIKVIFGPRQTWSDGLEEGYKRFYKSVEVRPPTLFCVIAKEKSDCGDLMGLPWPTASQ